MKINFFLPMNKNTLKSENNNHQKKREKKIEEVKY